jgi:CRP-like cAMP-binding protein
MILGQRDGKALPQRCWAYFHVDSRFSPQRVCNAIDEGLRGSAIENVASTPPPACLVLDFGKDMHDSYANYGVQYWIEDLSTNDSTGSRVRKRIYAALERAGIPLAIPAQMQLTQMHDAAHRAAHDAREAAEHMTAIRTVGLLKSLDEDELKTLADGLQPAPFVEGEVITRQGAVAHYLYILTSGKADVRATSAGVTHTVATLHAPDFFGEMGLVTGEPRSADVVAATDVECFRLDKTTFTTVLMHRPSIAEELSLRLAQRRVGLDAAREGLDEAARLKREASERARILGGIKGFFGL